MNDSEKLSKAYALQLLATAVSECRRAGLKVTTFSDKGWLSISVRGAYILQGSDETFAPVEDDDE